MEAFVSALNSLRRRAAFGTGKARVSIDDLARATRIPRSTVHVYVSGRVIPPADALAQIITALGGDQREVKRWIVALDRIATNPPAQSAAVDNAAPVPRQLPPLARDFVGRERELTALDEALRPSHGVGRLVALVGAGGVGKTAIVGQWAAQHLDEYPDGVLYTDLRGYSSQEPVGPERTLTRFLAALGHNTALLPPTLDERMDVFRTAVSGRRLLLILDNAQGEEQVQPFLPGTTRSDVVLTSRDQLRGLGVRNGAVRLQVGPLADADARRLLSRLPGRAPQIDAVLNLCGGLPLALQVVRERAEALGSLGGVLSEVADGEPLLDVLALNRETGGEVRTILDWSYRTLPPSTQRFLRLTSLLPGPTVGLDSSAAIAGLSRVAARRELEALAQRSLLTPLDPDLWARHDLVAALAQERLEAEDAPEVVGEALTRILGYHMALVERATLDDELCLLPWPEGVPHPELPLDRAQAWARLADNDVLIRVTVGSVGRMDARAIVTLAERTMWAYDEMRYPSGSPLQEETLEVARDSGDRLGEAALLLRFGDHHARRAELAEAEEKLRAALVIADELGLEKVRLLALNSLGLACAYASRFEEGRRALEEALAGTSDDQPVLRSSIHLNLGILHDSRRDAELTEKHYRAAARPTADGSVPLSGILGLVNLASSLIDDGNLQEAGVVLDEARALKGVHQPSRARTALLLVEAQWAAWTGLHDAAANLLADVENAVSEQPDPFLGLQFLHVSADLAALAGRDDDAVELYRSALDQSVARDMPFDEVSLRKSLAPALERTGRVEEARGEYVEALAVAEAAGLTGPVLTELTEGLRQLEEAQAER
ncbi:AAA family ATPase [Nigerium massiliense]|uniref:AAA family ATPase n=1 Tax=Nigerium massiliense TaxID=1522317 RepID=UPI0006932BF5|nr:AAA family ATPase [Nigerium massiliense]